MAGVVSDDRLFRAAVIRIKYHFRDSNLEKAFSVLIMPVCGVVTSVEVDPGDSKS